MDNLVNDEFAVGFDERFEHRFRYLQWAGRLVLLAVVGLALFGFLGRGPFSHATAGLADGSLSVDYEPVARWGTTTQVTLHVQHPRDVDQITIDTKMVEPMGLQSVTPTPATEAVDGSGARLTMPAVPGRPALIRFYLKPTVVGPVAMQVRVDDGPVLRWTQVVLP